MDVYIDTDGSVKVYPLGYPTEDGEGSEFHYYYNPITGEWEVRR